MEKDKGLQIKSRFNIFYHGEVGKRNQGQVILKEDSLEVKLEKRCDTECCQ